VSAKAIEAIVERAQGRRVSRGKALLAAAAAGVLVYRVLRSGDDGDGSSEGDGSGSDG
jgi:hypothetical protein